MSIVRALEVEGEALSPAARGALVASEARARALEDENRLLRERAEALEERLRLATEENTLLRERIRVLEERSRELERRLGMNSTNSSKPPSSDPPGTIRRRKRRSGRKRGGQRGHPGTCRTLLPPERVDEIVHHRPAHCRRCRASLAGAAEVGTTGRHQVIELPEVRARVMEHRTHTLACPDCGQWTEAPLPAELQRRHFGPRLVAMSVLLMSHFRLSRRKLTEFLGDLLDVPAPATGTTQAFADEARRALHAPYLEALRAVRQSPVVGADETEWRLRGLRRVLWVGVAARAVVYRLGRSRGGRDRRRLVGRQYPGILVTDRWRSYDAHPVGRRQLCWAHLRRNWEGVESGGGSAAPLATEALGFCHTLFRCWAEYTEGRMTHPELRAALLPLQPSFRSLLEQAAACEDKKSRALGRDLIRLWPALWTFLQHEGVPVTNNAAERALRGAVIWRKTSFGSKSGRGMRFAERVLTVTETLRMHQRNILDYFTESISRHRENRPAPRLLPVR